MGGGGIYEKFIYIRLILTLKQTAYEYKEPVSDRTALMPIML